MLRRLSQSPKVARFLTNRVAVAATAVLLLLVVVAAIAPMLAPQDPNHQDLANPLRSPSGDHLLGTDALGRDTLSRLIMATRVSMVAAALATGVAILGGVPAGLLAGYLGGWIDAVLGRITDALLTMPPLILAMAIIGVLGPGLTNAMFAVGVVFAPRFFRVARGAGQSVRSETYILACRAMGCSTGRILWRHVMPNTSGPLLVQTSFTAGLAITAEASLSFLGLGLRPPAASWGSMTQQAFTTLTTNSFPIFPPVAMVIVAILAFSVIGDAWRDVLGQGAIGPRRGPRWRLVRRVDPTVAVPPVEGQ
ncbi:MAG TPA: ABC transporter permease [Acidimicrobiales bacterium]|nr:ABC transporter permease [Acidimicrobiales bacterium]